MGDFFLVTGGKNYIFDERSVNTVIKYSRTGSVEYLPAFNHRRHNHACSSYVSDGGETAGFIVLKMNIL